MTNMNKVKKWIKSLQKFPLVLVIFGLIGLSASIAIAAEKEHLLNNPGTDLPCNLNPIYSCSNVFMSEQSHILGVSNEYLGIAVFGALIALGVVLLAGATLKKWFWLLFLAGMAGSMAVVFWFFYQSVYVIGSLCIFCSIVWFSTWTITVVGFSWLVDTKQFTVKKQYQPILSALRSYSALIWFLLILSFATLIVRHFWYYYGQYFN